MKIMIGELNASSGSVYINGYDLNADYSKARQNLGYCPQFDYLPDYLTVSETLKLFAFSPIMAYNRNKCTKKLFK